MLAIIATLVTYSPPVQELLAEEPREVVEKEVLIEVQIDWTQERIIQEIVNTFPEDTETALAIARCESGYNPDAINTSNPNGSVDRGVFQINSVHNSHLSEMELDPFDPGDNIKFARHLYIAHGWTPWVCYTHKMI